MINNYFAYKGIKKATDEYFVSKNYSIKYYPLIDRAIIYL